VPNPFAQKFSKNETTSKRAHGKCGPKRQVHWDVSRIKRIVVNKRAEQTDNYKDAQLENPKKNAAKPRLRSTNANMGDKGFGPSKKLIANTADPKNMVTSAYWLIALIRPKSSNVFAVATLYHKDPIISTT